MDDYGEILRAFDHLRLHNKIPSVMPYPETPADLALEPVFTRETPVEVNPFARLVVQQHVASIWQGVASTRVFHVSFVVGIFQHLYY